MGCKTTTHSDIPVIFSDTTIHRYSQHSASFVPHNRHTGSGGYDQFVRIAPPCSTLFYLLTTVDRPVTAYTSRSCLMWRKAPHIMPAFTEKHHISSIEISHNMPLERCRVMDGEPGANNPPITVAHHLQNPHPNVQYFGYVGTFTVQYSS